MIGYIYKTTNLINNKCYIGKHQSAEYDPSYFGSGKIVQRAIDKYGIENFSNEIIDIADTIQELNEKEKLHIKYYKETFGDSCYNIANGGDGGNVLMYMPAEEKKAFVDKMTTINKQRCNTEEFKTRLSIATSQRYADNQVRELHAQKVKEAWQDKNLREQQSNRLKGYYMNHKHDCSFNYIPCAFELNGERIEFESVKALREFLIDEYQYNPDRRTFNKLMEMGSQGIPYNPFHKNNLKLQRLKGMLIYKIR